MSVKMPLIQVPLPSFEDNDKNPFGQRTPPRPLSGGIDFDLNEVILPMQVEDIESYEIMDEEQTTVLYVGCDEAEFVETLSTFKDPVVVVITTTSFRLIGYPEI